METSQSNGDVCGCYPFFVKRSQRKVDGKSLALVGSLVQLNQKNAAKCISSWLVMEWWQFQSPNYRPRIGCSICSTQLSPQTPRHGLWTTNFRSDNGEAEEDSQLLALPISIYSAQILSSKSTVQENRFTQINVWVKLKTRITDTTKNESSAHKIENQCHSHILLTICCFKHVFLIKPPELPLPIRGAEQ